MATITASTFQTVFNAQDLAEENAEILLDLAIDVLNLFSDADLPNLSGDAGSKSVSLESKQKGAVFLAAHAIYRGCYKGPEGVTVSGEGLSVVDVLGNPAVLSIVKQAARQLADLDVGYG